MTMEIQLPQGKIQWSRTGGPLLVVVAGGRRPDPQWLRRAAEGLPVAAADRGADHCRAAGLVPGFLYGDRDSAAPGAWEEFARKGARVKTYPVNKDDTDLSLVLQDIPGDRTVLATGIWGGRADHLFGNLYTLLSYAERGGSAVLADDQEVLCYLLAGESLTFAAGKKRPRAVSLLPLTPSCRVSITGVRWPLDNAELTQSNPYAVSNKMTEPALNAFCREGIAGVYFTWKE